MSPRFNFWDARNMGFFGRLIFALIAIGGYGFAALVLAMLQGPHSAPDGAKWVTGLALGTTGLLVVWRWICGGARQR